MHKKQDRPAQQALEAERNALEDRRVDLASRVQVLAERQTAIDDALQVARRQIADLTTRLEQVHSLLNRRDGDVDTLRSSLPTLAEQRRSHEEAGCRLEERRRLVSGDCCCRSMGKGKRPSRRKRLHEAEVDLNSMRQALASANERSSELRGLLEAQNASSAAAFNQLNLLLAERARKMPAAPATRRRRT